MTGETGHSSGIFGADRGSGAVYEAARILAAFQAELGAEKYLTINPSVIVGGTKAALDDYRGTRRGQDQRDRADRHARGDIRYISLDQERSARERMQAIVARHLPRTGATLRFDDGAYPPMTPTPANEALLQVLDEASRDLGLGPVAALDPAKRGAGDIGFIAHLLPCLDGLGSGGGGEHARTGGVHGPRHADADGAARRRADPSPAPTESGMAGRRPVVGEARPPLPGRAAAVRRPRARLARCRGHADLRLSRRARAREPLATARRARCGAALPHDVYYAIKANRFRPAARRPACARTLRRRRLLAGGSAARARARFSRGRDLIHRTRGVGAGPRGPAVASGRARQLRCDQHDPPARPALPGPRDRHPPESRARRRLQRAAALCRREADQVRRVPGPVRGGDRGRANRPVCASTRCIFTSAAATRATRSTCSTRSSAARGRSSTRTRTFAA